MCLHFELASNWCNSKSFSMCEHIHLKKSFVILLFIIFHVLLLHVSTILCHCHRYHRHNHHLPINRPRPLSPVFLSILISQNESIFCLKCFCSFHQMCKHFRFSISFEWFLRMLLLLYSNEITCRYSKKNDNKNLFKSIYYCCCIFRHLWCCFFTFPFFSTQIT